MTQFYRAFLSLCDKFATNPTAVAKKIGISSSAPVRWKNGDSLPQRKTLEKIVSIFGLTVEEFKEYSRALENEREENERIYLTRNLYLDNGRMFDKIKDKVKMIPVFGRVAAGVPLEAIGDIVDQEQLSPDMDMSYQYAGLIIHGDSMFPYYLDGDVVIVRLQESVESGDIAIVFINGTDATCKKILHVEDGIELVSLNEKYGRMFFTHEQIKTLPVTIWGKVVELRRKV